jgi:hypothetical protein
LAGFAALAASLIAYNASTFAAGIVTGMANGNFSGTMAAVQGSINGARAIATGMQQMSQSTHDMSQANKAEAQDKKAEQTTGANAAGDSSYVHPSTTSTPLGQRGDVNSSNSSSSGPSSTNGSVQAPGVTQSQSTQVQSQTNSANGIATSTEISKASNGSVASVAGTNPSPPVAPAGDKENPLDSPHLKSFEQHLKVLRSGMARALRTCPISRKMTLITS